MTALNQPPTVQPRTLARSRVLWEQSLLDLKIARKSCRAHAYLESAHLSLQAAVNALSAVCVLHGHFQLPAASAQGLLTLCRSVDSRFEELAEACHALDLAAAASPFEPPETSDVGKEMGDLCIGHAEGVLAVVKGFLRDHKKQFLAP